MNPAQPVSSQPAMTSTPTAPDEIPQTPREIITHLENLTHLIIDAVNTRSFSPDDPLTSASIETDFTAAATPPHAPRTRSLDAWRAGMLALTAEWPEYALRIISLETVLHERLAFASVFMDFEAVGRPLGVVRRRVGCLKFRKRGGLWRMYAYEGVENMELL